MKKIALFVGVMTFNAAFAAPVELKGIPIFNLSNHDMEINYRICSFVPGEGDKKICKEEQKLIIKAKINNADKSYILFPKPEKIDIEGRFSTLIVTAANIQDINGVIISSGKFIDEDLNGSCQGYWDKFKKPNGKFYEFTQALILDDMKDSPYIFCKSEMYHIN